MTRPTLRRTLGLLAGLAAMPVAWGQSAETHAPLDALAMFAFPVLGMLFVLAVIAIVNINEHRQYRARLATIERLIGAGHTVPRELIVPEAAKLTLPEERRRDVRRGIALLFWAAGIGLFFYFGFGRQPRAAAWCLLFLLPSLGSFLRAWLTGREIARGASNGTP